MDRLGVVLEATEVKSGGRVAIRTFRKDWLEQKQVLKLKKIVAGLQARKHKFILRCISFREDETCYYLIEELPANYKSLLELTFECLKSDQLHKIGEAVGSIFNAFKDYPVSESKKNYLTSFFAHPDNFLFEEADPTRLKVRTLDYIYCLESFEATPPSLGHVVGVHPDVLPPECESRGERGPPARSGGLLHQPVPLFLGARHVPEPEEQNIRHN